MQLGKGTGELYKLLCVTKLISFKYAEHCNMCVICLCGTDHRSDSTQKSYVKI